ncbi:outer membrane protein assembly factor BamB family protein [Streptomyces sp. NPDC001970]
MYRADDLSCRHLYHSYWPVNSIDFHPSLPLVAAGTGRYDGSWDFDGELLLVNLESGMVTTALEERREVLAAEWLDDRRLRLLVSPEDRDSDHAFTHAFETVIEREDWSAVADRTVGYRELTGPKVRRVHPPDADQARDLLRDRSVGAAAGWTMRRQVRATQMLDDGRVLAALQGARLECWLTSGELQWAVPDLDGGQQIHVCTDQRSAWVHVRHTGRLTESGWRRAGNLVQRISLDSGRSLEEFDPGHAVTFTSGRDGWLAVRAAWPARDQGQTILLTPDNTEAAHFILPNHDFFAVRRGSEPLFVQRAEGPSAERQRVVAIALEETDGSPSVRRLFPLDWDGDRTMHLFAGPGTQVSSDALVYAATLHDHRGLLPQTSFIVRRRLPDGAPQWVYGTDHPVTALDADEDTVFAAYRSGEIVALDARNGSPLWQRALHVSSRPVVPLSLTVPRAGRLLIGTVDGRILDCETTTGRGADRPGAASPGP